MKQAFKYEKKLYEPSCIFFLNTPENDFPRKLLCCSCNQFKILTRFFFLEYTQIHSFSVLTQNVSTMKESNFPSSFKLDVCSQTFLKHWIWRIAQNLLMLDELWIRNGQNTLVYIWKAEDDDTKGSVNLDIPIQRRSYILMRYISLSAENCPKRSLLSPCLLLSLEYHFAKWHIGLFMK